MHAHPLVSVVMPVRNESEHIGFALDAIDAQTYPASHIEIIVVDGGSTDGTLEILRRRMKTDARIRVLGGQGVNTPLAMELGSASALGEVIAKVDGHGWINDQFISAAVHQLMEDSGLGCVGGIVQPIAKSNMERAIAIARFSRFGVGGGVYTLPEHAQEADTVQCGVYRRQALIDAGGFDSELPFGEDEEANYRLRACGWRIRLDPRMRFSYRVRRSIRSLFRQYFRYGRARVAVIRKHPAFFRIKHALPALLVVALSTLPMVAMPGPWSSVPAIPWAAYAAFVAVGAAFLGAKHRFVHIHLVIGSLIALHLGYGSGTLVGLFSPSTQRSRMTRPPS